MTYSERSNQLYKLAERAVESHLPDTELRQNEVCEAMRYSVGAGGKRVRPMLLLAFCQALGGDPEKVLPFAAALEYIHSYSLIHDDLPCMDDDDMRRGKPSCHIAFGEAIALLAGDALLTLAFETMLPACACTGGVEAANVLAHAAGVYGMVGGQVLDLQSEDRPLSEDSLLRMYRLKTGELLAAGCRMGALLAGADAETVELAGAYGFDLGMAFQIIDDMLDIYGDTATLGKPTGSDWDNHKLTYAALHSRSESERKAAELTESAVSLLERICPEDTFLPQFTRELLTRNK